MHEQRCLAGYRINSSNPLLEDFKALLTPFRAQGFVLVEFVLSIRKCWFTLNGAPNAFSLFCSAVVLFTRTYAIWCGEWYILLLLAMLFAVRYFLPDLHFLRFLNSKPRVR